MNYKQTGIAKTINVDGIDYDINAAMTDSVGTKDFTYTNTIKNFNNKTKVTPDSKLFNTDLFSKEGIKDFAGIENYSKILNKNINYTVPNMEAYNKFIDEERSDESIYFKADNTKAANAFNPLNDYGVPVIPKEKLI
jgi:hypothetical protein